MLHCCYRRRFLGSEGHSTALDNLLCNCIARASRHTQTSRDEVRLARLLWQVRSRCAQQDQATPPLQTVAVKGKAATPTACACPHRLSQSKNMWTELQF